MSKHFVQFVLLFVVVVLLMLGVTAYVDLREAEQAPPVMEETLVEESLPPVDEPVE